MKWKSVIMANGSRTRASSAPNITVAVLEKEASQTAKKSRETPYMIQQIPKIRVCRFAFWVKGSSRLMARLLFRGPVLSYVSNGRHTCLQLLVDVAFGFLTSSSFTTC